MSHQPTAPLENLRRRSELLRSLRRFFDERSFVEVQTPLLSADVIVDRYVDPIEVSDPSLPLTPHGNRVYYLQTSPEFAMKRLLAAGMEAIYQLGPVFRKGDRGDRHNVEFTMLEWYRRGDGYREGMDLLEELIRTVAGSSFQLSLASYREVFIRYADLDPHRASALELKERADSAGVSYPASFLSPNWESEPDPWLDFLFSELVQPRLKADIVYDFPCSQSQLARQRTERDAEGEYVVSERFELYLNGIEIANGYHESSDAAELRRRFQVIRKRRSEDGRSPLPLESRMLAAMERGFPVASGTALGVDRLLMVLLGADRIDDVLTFPIERA